MTRDEALESYYTIVQKVKRQYPSRRSHTLITKAQNLAIQFKFTEKEKSKSPFKSLLELRVKKLGRRKH
jgi:hypothetical protein